MHNYACSDLHGQWWAWEKIKSILQPEDTLFFLGDAIDRGPDGIKIIMDMMKHPCQIHYLKGNHEDMMYRAYSNDSDAYDWYICWMNNGGRVTERAFLELEPEKKEEIRTFLCELPEFAVYENKNHIQIWMNHSGYIDEFEIRKSYEEFPELWDRRHYMFETNCIPNNTVVIHGHTPIICLQDERDDLEPYNGGAYWYNGRKKCCIDCGVHFTDQTLLLDLDTFKEIKIEKENMQ